MDLTASFAWTGTHSFSKSVSGSAYSLSLSNTSNTASSDAKQVISVGGSSAGDAFTNWNVSGVTNWIAGIDNSVSGDLWQLQKAAAFDGNYLLRAADGGSGGTSYLQILNNYNIANSNAFSLVSVAGSTAGDAYYRCEVGGVTDWVFGIDNSNSDIWALQKAAAITSDYLVFADQPGSGGTNYFYLQNSFNTASSDAQLGVQVGGASAGDPHILLGIVGVSNFSIGIDNSDSDKFKIGTGAVGTNTYFQIDTSGNTTLFGDQTANTDGAYDSGIWDFCTATTFALYGNTTPSRPNIQVDTTTGGGVMFNVCHPTLYLTRNVSFTYGGAVYTAGAPAATGYVNMSVNGTNYKLLCST